MNVSQDLVDREATARRRRVVPYTGPARRFDPDEVALHGFVRDVREDEIDEFYNEHPTPLPAVRN